MISEVSQSVTGGAASRPSGGVGGVGRVQGKAPVEAPTAVPAADAARDPASPAVVDGRNLEGIVENLNELAQTVQRQLQFTVDQDSGKTVIKVIDTENEEVIRQIPPEDILEMQKRLGEMNGLLFQSSA